MLTQHQYQAALEVIGRLWEGHGHPAPLSDPKQRRDWQGVPYTLHELVPAAFPSDAAYRA